MPDIADDTWDWGVYFESSNSKNECEDYYYLLMWYFANNIQIIKYQENWFSICKVSEFIFNNINVFDKFMNEENCVEFKPNEYEKIESIDDELMVDIYLPTLENLMIGNYSENGYKKLYNYLIENNN